MIFLNMLILILERNGKSFQIESQDKGPKESEGKIKS